MKPNAILLIIAIVIFLMGTFTGCFIERKFIAEPCAELIKSDTVRVVAFDSAAVNANIHSKPKKTIHGKFNMYRNSRKIDTIHCDTLRLITRELIILADTSFYSDTLRNDTSHSVVVNDTIVGHRLGLGVEFKNLRPLVKETVMNTVMNTVMKKPKPQIYLGAIVGLNNKANNFLAAPSVAVSYKAALLNYSFDIKNQMHMVGGYVRVFGK